jgi:DNA-binding sugar fermentation-stimulating protein
LLFPGSNLILEKRDGIKAKTLWTAVAIRRGATIAPLYASRANQAAKALILSKIIPGLKEIHPEYKHGSSRFDFLIFDE